MCMSIALAANLQLFVQDMSIVFEILSRWIFFCTDSFCYCLSTVLCFCPTVPSQSFLADFCTVRQSLSLFWFDSWSFWIFWALLAWCLARLIFDWLFVPFSFASAKPRRVFAARFIGGRRYRQARKPCARFRKHQSSQFYLRIVRLGLQFLSGPISGFFAVMRRASSYGELATQCLTPASRGCNAGDGPAVAMEHDAWATYMKNKARPSTPKPKHAKPEKPQRARWVDLEIDLTYVEGGLLQLSPEDFKTNATGLVLLTRQMFIEASAVRSTAPLAVLLPGDRNSDLIAAGINDSAIHVKYAFLRDALLGKYFRKKVTMVQLGANPVGFADPSGDKDWSNEAYCDFSVFISKQVFEDDNWSAYIAASRKEIPAKIRNLHTGLTAETCPFFAWRKLDDGTHRATFRAPTKHEKLFLQASGILGPFFYPEDVSHPGRKSCACARDRGIVARQEDILRCSCLDTLL